MHDNAINQSGSLTYRNILKILKAYILFCNFYKFNFRANPFYIRFAFFSAEPLFVYLSLKVFPNT